MLVSKYFGVFEVVSVKSLIARGFVTGFLGVGFGTVFCAGFCMGFGAVGFGF